MWIHEHGNWPNLDWDAGRLASMLADVRHRQGLLLGRLQSLGFELRQEASLHNLVKDVVESSAIEGEHLNPDDVRSSIARRLGIESAGPAPASRDVEGIVEITLDATQEYSTALTRVRLFDWHAALFPTGRSGLRRITVGGWRKEEAGPMQVVSGPIGKERIHFEAPGAGRLEKEMRAFLKWFENGGDTDPVLKAGVAHLWFVTIHPFEDGNGRVARAISDMALARADGMRERFYSMSSQINAERKDYYDRLERQQRGTPDISDWLEWSLGCLGRALASAETALGHVLFKAELWNHINKDPVNGRQRTIINRMLEEGFTGHMNTSKYAGTAKCSTDTALRDIQELKARGILLQNPGGGRSTSYRLPDRSEIFRRRVSPAPRDATAAAGGST